MNLANLFVKDVITAAPHETIEADAKRMAERNVGAVVVTVDERPVGIVTDRDLAISLGAWGCSPADPVQSVMTSPATTIPRDEGVFNATQYMMENALRRLPVVDERGSLVGIVTLDDLLLFDTRPLRAKFRPESGARGQVRVRR
jgi:CBS domain-containing protein